MVRNRIPSVCFYCCSTERNSELFSLPRFRIELREFTSIFVPWYGIPGIFLLCRTVRNGIPRVFCSAEQPESRRNKPIVPSIPSLWNNYFCQKWPTLPLCPTESNLQDFWIVSYTIYFFASNSLRRSEKETFVGYLQRAAVQINPEK
jgi:hypothetical protein